ncbi:MAG: transglutaminase domain-containing protein [Planctomycetes bacterium]|nr:transglutaminase domain-containing protein [Planctomycetota bacterium]
MILHLLLLTGSVSAAPGDAPRSPAPGLIEYVNPARYEITQSINATNTDVSALELLELNLPIPQNWPEQHVSDVAVTGDATFRLRDLEGMGTIVRSLYRQAGQGPKPGESRTLTVTYRLECREIRTDSAALATRRYPSYDQRSPDYRRFTRGEKLIEADAPPIAALAQELRRQAPGPYAYARAAFDHVVDHTEYVSPSPAQGALECLQKGKADCGSYAALFVALCRAGGVPARPVAGCWALGDNQWHCWAEFLLPGVGWVPADPTAAQRGAGERAYYFGNLDNNRVALAKTFNLTVNTTRGSRELGFVQVGTWWWVPAPGSSGSRMGVEHRFRGAKAPD